MQAENKAMYVEEIENYINSRTAFITYDINEYIADIKTEAIKATANPVENAF